MQDGRTISAYVWHSKAQAHYYTTTRIFRICILTVPSCYPVNNGTFFKKRFSKLKSMIIQFTGAHITVTLRGSIVGYSHIGQIYYTLYRYLLYMEPFSSFYACRQNGNNSNAPSVAHLGFCDTFG